MPARKRNKQQPEHPDPVVRFGRALVREKERERAEQIRIQAERDEAKRLATLAAERAERLRSARNRLDRAIAAVKQHRGQDAVEAEYRDAKAAVIELETGQRPDWAARVAGTDDDAGDVDARDVDAGEQSLE